MSSKYKRPLPKEHGSVNVKDHFELRYLRWDYLVRAENLSSEKLKSVSKAVSYISRKIYNRYSYEFSFFGIQPEDVESVANVHAVSFFGLYGSENNPQAMDRYIKKKESQSGVVPDKAAIDKKEVSNMMSFIGHRLEDFAFQVKKKCTNSPGFRECKMYVQVIPGQWPSHHNDLVENPSKYGWAAVSRRHYKTLGSMAKGMVPGESFTYNGKNYMLGEPNNSWIDIWDYRGGRFKDFGELGTEHLSPSTEDVLLEAEESNVKIRTFNGVTLKLSRQDKLDRIFAKFNNLSDEKKVTFLKKLHVFFKKSKIDPKRIEKIHALKKRINKNINGNQAS